MAFLRYCFLSSSRRGEEDAMRENRFTTQRHKLGGKGKVMAGLDEWPTELRLKDQGQTLSVSFEGGGHFDLEAEFLRVSSPSAEVQGHSAAERKTVGGKRNVRIVSVVPVGNYAVKLVFDDGHDTGLFTWAYLHELGLEHDARWDTYLAEIAAKHLQR